MKKEKVKIYKEGRKAVKPVITRHVKQEVEPMSEKFKPCPFCGDAWVYASTGDYGSGYEHYGYRVNCRCHYAWSVIGWHERKADVIAAWNRRAKNE